MRQPFLKLCIFEVLKLALPFLESLKLSFVELCRFNTLFKRFILFYIKEFIYWLLGS